MVMLFHKNIAVEEDKAKQNCLEASNKKFGSGFLSKLKKIAIHL